MARENVLHFKLKILARDLKRFATPAIGGCDGGEDSGVPLE